MRWSRSGAARGTFPISTVSGMPYLFDTNAFSETFRPRPNRALVAWLGTLPREEQFTSTVVVAELYAAAFRTPSSGYWFLRVEEEILPSCTVLPFDLACARSAGEIQGRLRREGKPIGAADIQIAATALVHSLVVVTANHRHFSRIPGLELKVFTPGEP